MVDARGGAAIHERLAGPTCAAMEQLDGRGARAARRRRRTAVDGPSIRSRLIGAAEDAESLRDVLHTATGREDPNADQPRHDRVDLLTSGTPTSDRFEQLAADVDPDVLPAVDGAHRRVDPLPGADGPARRGTADADGAQRPRRRQR